MEQIQLEEEVKALQERNAELSQRLSEAQTQKRTAQEKIVAGDPEAARAAAEADQSITALSAACSSVSSQISSKQNRIVAIKNAAIHSAKMDELAAHALRCCASKRKLFHHFDEAVAAVRAAFACMDGAREEFTKDKQEFNVALQANVRDFAIRQAQNDASLTTEMSQIARELKARGASLDDGLTVFGDLWERWVYSEGFAKNVSIVRTPAGARSIERSVQLAFNEKLR